MRKIYTAALSVLIRSRKMRKIYTAALSVLIMGTIFLNRYSYAFAHDSRHSRDDLAHRLAVRYGISENDVRSFLNDYYGQRQETDRTYSSHKDHLSFIDGKLTEGVRDRWITQTQKNQVMAKLQEKMESGPSPEEYRRMSESELKDRINVWQKEMRKWSRDRGFTLDLIKNLTGKGNKYLMGVEL